MNTSHFAGRPVAFSAGGYFRLFPYSWIHHWTRNSDYVMAYFHPRDFDPGQPVFKHLPLSRRVKSYYGLHSAFQKFEVWLSDFRFLSLRQAETIIDRTNTRTVAANVA
jgi:hypothetical protein